MLLDRQLLRMKWEVLDQLTVFNESFDDSWNSFPTAFTHCAQKFIMWISSEICRYIYFTSLVKCISLRCGEGFRSVHVWLRTMENERKVDEDLFIVKGLHSVVAFQSSIMKIYFSTIISITFRAWNEGRWRGEHSSNRFSLLTIVVRTDVGTNVLRCHDEVNQNKFSLPPMRKIKLINAFLTFGNDARTCCFTSHSNLSTGNCRHL